MTPSRDALSGACMLLALLISSTVTEASRDPGGTTPVRDAGTTWPLPIPEEGALRSLSDLRGVLVHFQSGDYQVDRAVFQIDDEGNVSFRELVGYDDEGNRLEHRAARPLGRRVQSLEDLTDLRVGNPGKIETLVDADFLAFGVDPDGFLRIQHLIGRGVESGHAVDRDRDRDIEEYTCGTSTVFGCFSACPLSCGEYPDCACNFFPFFCFGYMEESCEGSCPTPLTCYNRNGACGCHPAPTTEDLDQQE